jgi:hypothetical protein
MELEKEFCGSSGRAPVERLHSLDYPRICFVTNVKQCEDFQMIDPLKESVLTYSQAARRLPKLRKDQPTHPTTIWRWATRGVRGVRLETVKVGGRTVTSFEALSRFFSALNRQSICGNSVATSEHDEKVAAELRSMGI